MDSRIRRKLAMAVRVLDFARQHPSSDTSFTGLITRLEQDVARLETLSVEEDAGHAGEVASRRTRRNVRRTMLRKLRHFARVARLAEVDQPLVQSFAVPSDGAPLHEISTTAKRMLAEATAQKELFLKYGLGEKFLESFSQALTAFDAATVNVHAGRGQHVGARAEIVSLGSECMMVVAALDGIVRDVYEHDSQVLGAWESARNVVGPFRKTSSEPDPSDKKAA